jgi:hypothetical protein
MPPTNFGKNKTKPHGICHPKKNSVSPLTVQSHRKAEKRPSFSGAAMVKKLGLSPDSTESSKSRKETEFFGCGDGEKNSVSPLKEQSHR